MDGRGTDDDDTPSHTQTQTSSQEPACETPKEKTSLGSERGRPQNYGFMCFRAARCSSRIKRARRVGLRGHCRRRAACLGGSCCTGRRRWPESRARQKERKKADRQLKRGIGGEDRVPTCTSRILEGRSGGQVGSPAPDKGHDRLAARCTVESQLHWRSHLSLATCLQLLAGSLSLPQAH